jgi:beta-glucosidase
MESRVAALVRDMSLAEKAAQMAQVDKGSVTPDDVARLGIGSILSGGGGNPDPNTAATWADMVEEFDIASRSSRLGIPILYGSDGVHGHSNVHGATIFPHNIGLGAAGDADLVERIYRATAIEMAATGVRWNFAPTVAVALDPRWGRTYEAFGDDPAAVSPLGAAAIRGLQAGADPSTSVLACAKHYVGDGGTGWRTVERPTWIDWWDGWGTEWCIDQGDTACDEETLRRVHLAPYVAAIDAGARTVMASYSSWNGDKLHGHHHLLTDVLKGELGFDGFLVSDWLGIDQLDPDPYRCVVTAIGAGIDMVMVPFAYERFISAVVQAVESGDLRMDRIDDAVTRILAVKASIGLLDTPLERPSLDRVGSTEHRELARSAVAASAVVLKDDSATLPVTAERVLVAGDAADDVGLQCGGWTIEWTGGSGPVTPGTSILTGLRQVAPEIEFTHVRHADTATDTRAPVGIVVVAERPYAEGLGDRGDLGLPDRDIELVERIRARVDSLILVLVSGRPLVIDAIADRCDAIVAAWLPGTEGDGIADVLLGRVDPTGRLPRPWPDAAGAERWGRGHGVTTR